MADQFSVYEPGPGAYLGFGISEGLRKHMEYLQQQRFQQERINQFQQELQFRRQSAEADSMERAQVLGEREREFNKSAASEQAKLDFDKEKFKEDKRQWSEEFPVRKRYMEDTATARETTAGAAVTRAGAAVTRAAGSGKAAYTPGGLGKLYADNWTKSFNEAAKTYSNDFTNIYSDEELYQKVSDQATQATRKAVTPYLNAYNEYVDSNPTAVGFTRMSFEDLEADPKVESRMKENSTDPKIGKEWNAVRSDKTFTSRFESLDITDKEIDLLRLNAPDLYKKYTENLKAKASDKLKQKMANDNAEKIRQIQVEKNADKR